MKQGIRDYRKTFNYGDLAKASKGCEESIDLILECFDALISKAATRELSDEYGNRYSYKDEYMNGRIKGRLISTILNFKTDLAKDRIADWNL